MPNKKGFSPASILISASILLLFLLTLWFYFNKSKIKAQPSFPQKTQNLKSGSTKLSVLDENENNIKGAKVKILKGDKELKTIEIDSSFELLKGLPPGIYYAYVEAPGFRTDKRDFEVKSNEETDLSIILGKVAPSPTL